MTFAREVRAILNARCVSCHAPGGSAPMPLTTYENVRPWARAIKEQVVSRRMPKWHAARGFGQFANDPTLSPFEIALLLSWIDGGLPRDVKATTSAAAPLSRAVPSAFVRHASASLSLPAGTAEAIRRMDHSWVTGWAFEPGEPLITSAAFSLADGTVIGNWVAGDAPVMLPANSGIEVTGRIRIALRRRPRADYEVEYAERPSVLRFSTRAALPAYRVWTVSGPCRSIDGTPNAQAIGIRPLLDTGASARITVDRMGARPAVVGWFRDFDAAYPRTYWFERPVEFGPDARLTSDSACAADVILRGAR